jgi:hypothetical protein
MQDIIRNSQPINPSANVNPSTFDRVSDQNSEVMNILLIKKVK